MNTIKYIISLIIFLAVSSSIFAQSQDPGAPGNFPVQRLEYDFGDSFSPSNYPDSVDVKGVVHFPTSGVNGSSPLVLIMHGRHGVCFDTTTNIAAVTYPCASNQGEIPSYTGYDYLGEFLAKKGYIVVSISGNGIWGKAGTSTTSDVFGINAGGELIQEHLNLWNTFNTVGGAPFNTTFIGKIDMSRIITIGHSRGGESIVSNFALNKNQPSPYGIQGVLSIAPTNFLRLAEPNMNHATILPYCDGDVSGLSGLLFYDNERYLSATDVGAKHIIAFKGGNHNFFNTIWTTGGFRSDAGDDWANLDANQVDPFCGAGASTRFNPTKQQSATKTYVASFVQTYARNQVQLSDAITGVNKEVPPSSGLVASDVSISYQAPSAKRIDFNRTNTPTNINTNTLGGAVTSQGLSTFRICGDQSTNFICGPLNLYDDHFQPNNTNLSQPANGLSRIELKWESSGAWVQNDIPTASQDVSAFTHLTFRALAPNTLQTPNINQGGQNFSIVLTDNNNNSASLNAKDYTTSLDQGLGNVFGVLPHNVNNSVIIPLIDFNGVNLNQIKNVRLVFDKKPMGEISLSDFSFTKIECVPGRPCSDGDPCTTGETYDANCNCTGGVANTADADNDGVCDANDICPSGDDNIDTDNDGTPDACDICPNAFFNDSDNDGICDDVDFCNGNNNIDGDGDGLPDACDPCPTDANNACTVTYCNSIGNFSTGTHIRGVKLAEIDNNTTNDFGRLNALYLSANLVQGNSYPITLKPNFGPNIQYTPFWSVWIDFNQDGDFDDLNEQIFSTLSPDAVFNETINVPLNALTGTTQMRVIMAEGSAPSPCGVYQNGETENYTINILAAGSCPDSDGDGVCDEHDICSLGNDNVDTDGDGTPDACDGCPNDSTNACTNTYCNTFGNFSNVTHITRVQFEQINRISGNDAGYENVTNLIANVEAGTTYPITLTANIDEDNLPQSGFAYTPRWSVWIDFNQDGSFFGPNEQVLDNVTNGDDPLVSTISIPANLTFTGNTRMRVMMTQGSVPNSCGDNSNGQYNAGETEDYTVNITIPACPDADNDGVCDADDICALGDDNVDTDNDGVPDSCDICALGDDNVDADNDGVPDACDICTSGDDNVDADNDGVPDACDICALGDDNVDTDGDGIPDACEVTYCSSTSNSVRDEFIQRVTIGSINNASTGSLGGYSDFTSISTQLSGAQSIVIVPQWTGSSFPEAYAVWIDYNHDGDFTDAGELVFSQAPSTNTPATGSFIVPASATTGATRMRVSMKYNDIPDPCESFSFGEVEDYTVVIVPGCPDADNDGVCDTNDICALGDDNVDTDNDGVPDACDICALGDDNVDTDGDGIPDACEVTYCSSSSNSVRDEFIQRVTIGSINNASTGSLGGYSDFTSISTQLSGAQSIVIVPQWTGRSFPEAYAVWIDYNHDGDFTDAGELVFSQAPSTNTPVTGSFTVPASATTGATRMRVSMKYNDIPDPCESFSFGEVEDYTVVINSIAARIADKTVDHETPFNSNPAQGYLTSNKTVGHKTYFSLYPNPAQDYITVDIKSQVALNDLVIEVYDVSGKLIKTKETSDLLNNLNIGELSQGVYFVHLKSDQNRFNERKMFVKSTN